MSKPKKETFEVVGGLPIVIGEDRYEQGDQFSATLEPEQREFLVSVGHLKKVSSAPDPVEDEDEPVEEEDGDTPLLSVMQTKRAGKKKGGR